MAETLVNFVLGKLADAAVKEVLLLHGVDKQMGKISRELSRIQAFLEDADGKKISDERQKNWVREIRDVAYWIEDVIDSALLLGEQTESPQVNNYVARAINAVGRIFKKQKTLPALHVLHVEIDQILKTIEEIGESRTRYGINNLGEGCGGPSPSLRLPVRPLILPDIDDPNVVGFNTDTDNIVNQLLDKSTSRRSVVSIVGVGGLGKTTLARKTYNRIDIKNNFKYRIWVTVSKEFKLIDLLKKIVKHFVNIDPSEHEGDEEYFLTKLYECFKGEKYLIVLDDVWTNDLWTQMEIALPDENNGSRVLITSRSLHVAQEADQGIEPYQLKFLSEDSSLELLIKKALSNQYPNKKYPDNLVDLAKQFVKKCGALPLALVVLGGLLSKKSDYIAWHKILRTMNWSVAGRACSAVLATSFEDLPLVLKSCFMYFALFPEDFLINAKALVRMWIAEGLIPEEKNRTLEDTGESFLEELVGRCMIQVSLRFFDGSIDQCRIHDLLRDLAIEKARDDSFLMVSSNIDDLVGCCNARRLTIQHSDCDKLNIYASKNLRSLGCFGPTPDCSKQRLLKVLRTEEIELQRLEGLTQLRYFQHAKWTNLRKDGYFERFISGLKCLQTLDLRQTDHTDLPDCIWHVKTLRHVLLSEYGFTAGPPSWANLRNLQSLTKVKNRTSWAVEGIPNLPNLREIDIEISKELSWKVVATLLGTLKYLIRLTLLISSYDLPGMRVFTFSPDLQSLDLEYCNVDESFCSFDINLFPVCLIELKLDDGIELEKDPMPTLEKLQNLKLLSLQRVRYHKKQMKFSAQGFALLEKLELANIANLEELNIEKGAMPMLKGLYISDCEHLRVPLGLQYLTSLENMYWESSDDSASIKENEIRDLCKHVPSVDIQWNSDHGSDIQSVPDGSDIQSVPDDSDIQSVSDGSEEEEEM